MITNIDNEDEEIQNVTPNPSNTIVINLEDIDQYDETILKLIKSPYWHPYSNIILYYHEHNQEILSKLFFSMWYYKAINVIIVQYDDTQKLLLISHYTPYVTEDYKLDQLYGCWTKRKITMPILKFQEGLICESQCHNVSIHSKLRANNLGTCIGYSTIAVPYNASHVLPTLNLFEDKSKNLHGFAFRTYATEVQPFLLIDVTGNGSYTLRNRDGMIWNSMAELMNFTIDLSPSFDVMKENFNYGVNIQHVFNLSHRNADLYLIPVYLFDLVFVKVDQTTLFKESGVCIISHRAGFDMTLFDGNTIRANRTAIAQFVCCFLSIWLLFSIYQIAEKSSLSLDQIGKDLMNAFRNVLLISLCNPPRWRTFRIFLTVSLWSFFLINFASQATIISFLTAVKRGKEVDTFEDVIDKGYPMYAMGSPDLILPDTEERFRIINSKIIPQLDLFDCIRNMTQDKQRFCLIDCAVGRYLERNRLNENGEQYLHVARHDRMHSHYLTMILQKYSPLTDRFNKFMVTFFEAGLVQKWEQYRYADIKSDATVRPLRINDVNNLFEMYCLSVGFTCIIFLLELFIFCGRQRSHECQTKRN